LHRVDRIRLARKRGGRIQLLSKQENNVSAGFFNAVLIVAPFWAVVLYWIWR
jgi:hypothetical protein